MNETVYVFTCTCTFSVQLAVLSLWITFVVDSNLMTKTE